MTRGTGAALAVLALIGCCSCTPDRPAPAGPSTPQPANSPASARPVPTPTSTSPEPGAAKHGCELVDFAILRHTGYQPTLDGVQPVPGPQSRGRELWCRTSLDQQAATGFAEISVSRYATAAGASRVMNADPPGEAWSSRPVQLGDEGRQEWLPESPADPQRGGNGNAIVRFGNVVVIVLLEIPEPKIGAQELADVALDEARAVATRTGLG